MQIPTSRSIYITRYTMNPDRMLNEDVMNEQLLLKLLWEVPYICEGCRNLHSVHSVQLNSV